MVPAGAIQLDHSYEKAKDKGYILFSFNSDEKQGYKLFTFLSDKSQNLQREWSYVTYTDGTNPQIGSSPVEHQNSTMSFSVNQNPDNISSAYHSHPFSYEPSKADISFSKKHPGVNTFIYFVPEHKSFQYNENGLITYPKMYYRTCMPSSIIKSKIVSR